MQSDRSKTKSRCKPEERYRREPCNASTGSGASCGETETLKIMEEFHELYEERLQKSGNCGQNSVDVTNQTLKDWVCDLTEQNRLLVDTVEELEREAIQRIRDLDNAATKSSPSREIDLAEKNERICKLETELQCYTQKLLHKEAQLKEQACELESLRISSKRNNDAICSDVKERMSFLEKEAKCLREVLSVKDVALLSLEQQVDDLQSQVKTFQEETGKKSLTTLRCVNTNLQAEVESLQAEVKQKDYDLEVLRNQLADMNDCLMDTKEHFKKSLVDMNTMTEYSQEDGDKLAAELSKKESEVKSLVETMRLERSKSENHLQELTRKLTHLQKGSRDVQSALTAEVADKHDVIVALRREVSQMEDQLRKSDMQTHFKDDIIKQLRKEVKVARAKDSLVEMLGLKVPPRSATRCEVERLSAELEEREAAVRRLEEALEAGAVPRLEAVASELRARLEQSRRSVVALCDRISYVSTYLRRLRDDEQLSVKCGLEALIHELNEDLEWNRETRRSVSSLDDGVAPDSVIIINRLPSRSLSLPDSSLQKPHEWSLRSWTGMSDANAMYNHRLNSRSKKEVDLCDSKMLVSNNFQSRENQSMKRALEYKKTDRNDLKKGFDPEVGKVESLQRNLEDSSAKLTAMWQQIKQLSLEVSNNSTYNDLEEFKEDTRLDQEVLGKLIKGIKEIVCSKHQPVGGAYTLNCLESNLTKIMQVLVNEKLLGSDSTTSSLGNEEDIRVNRINLQRRHSQIDLSMILNTIITNINDCLCILEGEKNNILPEGTGQVFSYLKNLQQPLSEIMMNREKAVQKICTIQKIQSESYCNISKLFLEFDKMYSIHQQTSQLMKDELKLLMRKISVQTSSSCSPNFDQESEENSQVIFDKIERNKEAEVSSCSGDMDLLETIKTFDEKSQETQRVMSEIIKELNLAVSSILEREEKGNHLERDVGCVLEFIVSTQQELANIRENLDTMEKKKLDISLIDLSITLAQIVFNLKRFIKSFDQFAEDKKYLEKIRFEWQKTLALLKVEFEKLQTDLINNVKLLRERVVYDSSGYASFRSGNSPDSVIIENLKSQLEVYKDQVQQLEGNLHKYSVSPSTVLSQRTSGDWDTFASINPTEPVDCSQQQLMEIQKDLKNTLEEAIKACNKDHDFYLEDDQQCSGDMTRLKSTLCELHRNLESRERVIENQQKTIQLLQDGLKRAKCDAEELDSRLNSLKSEKENVEIENQKVMQELQTKICSLQESLQKEQCNTVSSNKGWVPWASKQPQQTRHVHDV